MSISKVDQGKILDFEVLEVINNFKFVRTYELGKMLWPQSRFSEKNAANQLQKLLKKEMVLQRRLPESNGFCYVLNKKGAFFLNNHFKNELFAKNMKNWGNFDEKGVWQPPQNWRHDLMALGLLAEYKKQGYKVISERQIKVKYTDLGKIPDGFISDEHGSGLGYFIEVERARKKGEDMDALAKSVMQGRKGEFFGFNVVQTIICFDFKQIDVNGESINHNVRFNNALRRNTAQGEIVKYGVADLKMRGAGVESVNFKMKKTFGSKAEAERIRALREVSQGVINADWETLPSGTIFGSWYGFLLKIEKEKDHFIWSVIQKSVILKSGDSETLKKAQKNCVLEAISLFKFLNI